MKKHYISFVAVILLLTACSNSASTATETLVPTETPNQPTSTPIPSTLTPEPTNTSIPTNTALPTDTPGPTNTPGLLEGFTGTKDEAIAIIQNKFIEQMNDILERGEGLEEIDGVNLVRFNEDGLFEIEVRSIYSSQDNQPDLSYKIISFLAVIFKSWDRENANILAGEHDFAIHITTYSADGDYRYQSTTDFETLQKVANKAISYEEWKSFAGADFK